MTVADDGANPARDPARGRHPRLRRLPAPGYLAAVDMLTRIDRDNDRAADVKASSAAPDEKTGRRQFEEITFEVCDSQRATDVSEKARRFVARGVRRVFYVRVDEGAVYEWRRASDA